MCQGFCHFSGFLHHFVLAKLATSSIRVKPPTLPGTHRTLEDFYTNQFPSRVHTKPNNFQLEIFFNPLMLKGTSKFVVRIHNTFDKNLEIKNKFTKYLKESCWWCSDQHFHQFLSQQCFHLRDFIKIVRLLLAAESFNGLSWFFFTNSCLSPPAGGGGGCVFHNFTKKGGCAYLGSVRLNVGIQHCS